MGINSLTHRDDASKVAVPVSTDDWQQWVSAGRTRNWMLDDPLIDWLQLYGKSRDYLLKQELAGYDKDLDFLEFIFDKGREFEAGILRLFQDQYDVTTVTQDYREISSLGKAEETFEAMMQGQPIIYQARPISWCEAMSCASCFLSRFRNRMQRYPRLAWDQTAGTTSWWTPSLRRFT